MTKQVSFTSHTSRRVTFFSNLDPENTKTDISAINYCRLPSQKGYLTSLTIEIIKSSCDTLATPSCMSRIILARRRRGQEVQPCQLGHVVGDVDGAEDDLRSGHQSASTRRKIVDLLCHAEQDV